MSTGTRKEEKRLSNGKATQLRLDGGSIVNVFDNGTVQVQGKNPEPLQTLLTGDTGTPRYEPSVNSREVFVVYGHDEAAKTQLEAMLRRWGLEPLFLDQLPSGGQTIIEKLEAYTGKPQFAVILATPDDEGYRRGYSEEKKFRARQNVVLEMGMMLALLGRSRVAILIKDQENMERPSDIQGLIYFPYKQSLDEVKIQLAKEMNAQGLHIDLKKL